MSFGFCIFLVGCSAEQPFLLSTPFETDKVLSSTSSVRQTFVRGDEGPIICTSPSPDTGFSENSDIDFSLNILQLSNTGESSEAYEGRDEIELSGRTPSLLITRELFYRACEFSKNFALDKEQALALYMATLDKTTGVWLNESKNTSITINQQISDQFTKLSNNDRDKAKAVEPETDPTDKESSDGDSTIDDDRY